MLEIKGFFGPYRFLSNFHYKTIVWDNKEYCSNEHLYQAWKCVLPEEREKVRLCQTARDARRLGQIIKLRPDWPRAKDTAMLIANDLKYMHQDMRELLLATQDAYLEETNSWGDTYWGVCNGQGQNKLGKILMQIRNELRSNSIEA